MRQSQVLYYLKTIPCAIIINQPRAKHGWS